MNSKENVKKVKAQSFMKNVLMLMCSQIIIKVLGLLYKLVIINADGFGNVGNGYYNTGYQLYALLLTLSSVGVPTVISKLVSERVAVGDNKSAHRIFQTALKLFGILGGIFSILLFFGADFIATNILNVPGVKYTLMVLAPAIVMVSISAVLRGYFSGLGSMKATSVSQTLEQFFNCILSITFVYAFVGNEPEIMAAAGNLSTTLAVIISLNYLIIYYKRRKAGIMEGVEKSTSDSEEKSTKQLVKIILALSIPMAIGSIISVINSAIDSVTISNCIQFAYEGIINSKEALENEAMRLAGILSKSETIIHLPLAINAAFCVALVPAISSALAKGDKKSAQKRLSFSFFASILILFPCAVGLTVIADQIINLLYPNAPEGGTILQLTTITMIFVGLNNIVNGGLYGIGKIHIPAISLAIGGIFKLVLNVILISNPDINIYGATYSSIVCQAIAFFISYFAMIKYIKLDLSFKQHLLKPAIASVIMGLVVFVSYNLLEIVIDPRVSTIIAILIGVIAYAFIVAVGKILSKEEIHMIPYGDKIYKILLKLKIYKET